jgi:YVTN family beta-propeller protein
MAGRGTMGWGFGRGAGSVLVAVALLAGCAPAEQPAGRGSSTLAQVGGDVYAVNVDEGTVSRIAEDGTVTTSAVLGREPTRITAAGHRLWVTLRADGEVAILDRDTLSLEKKVPVGAEPYGAVATAEDRKSVV